MKGYFGIGIYHPKHHQNIGTLMRSAVCFGATKLFTIGRRYHRQSSDTVNAICQVPTYHYASFDELYTHFVLVNAGISEWPVYCMLDGSNWHYTLRNVPQEPQEIRRTVWVNVYPEPAESFAHPTRRRADAGAGSCDTRLACLRVEIVGKEGQFDE